MATPAVIYTHAVRDNPIEKPSTQPTLAFDKLQQPVLASHLQSDDPLVIAAALVSLKRILSNVLSAPAAHDSGVAQLLGQLAESFQCDDEHASLEIRQDALRCIKLILSSPASRTESL
jgi:hypothetical protein